MKPSQYLGWRQIFKFLSNPFFSGFSLVFLLFCQPSQTVPNAFDPINAGSLSLQLLYSTNTPTPDPVAPTAFGSISSDLQNGDYPLFLKTGYLDLTFEQPISDQFPKTDFAFEGEAALAIIVRDLAILSDQSLRLFLSVDSTKKLPSTLKLKKLNSSGTLDNRFSNPELNFKIPSSRLAGTLSEEKSQMSGLKLNSKTFLMVGGLSKTNALLKTVEIYDFDSETSSKLPDLPEGLIHPSLTLLASGSVLVVGGETASPTTQSSHFSKKIILIDPSQRSVTTLPFELNQGRSRHSAVLLPTNQILVSGGLFTTGTTESSVLSNHEILNIVDYTSNTLPASAGLRQSSGSVLPRFGHWAYLDRSKNSVLFALGKSRTENAVTAFTLEIVSLDLNTFTATVLPNKFNASRIEFKAFQDGTDDIVFIGGSGPFGLSTNSVEKLKISNLSVENQGTLFTGRMNSGSELLPSQKQILSLGGTSLAFSIPGIEVFSLVEKKSFSIGSLLYPRKNLLSVSGRQGIYSFGDPEFAGNKVEYFGVD